MISREALHQADFSDVATDHLIGPITPGNVLLEEFMKPLGLSARGLARDIAVPPNRITAILHGERAITEAKVRHPGRQAQKLRHHRFSNLV